MLEVVILGVSLHATTHVPLLLLYPLGTDKIICLHVDPIEAFLISKALHGYGISKPHEEKLIYEDSITETDKDGLTREEKILRRPMLHDLLIGALKSLGSRVNSVALLEHKEDTYVAKVVFEGPHKFFSQSCRPADAIALALRAKVAIHIDDSLIPYAEDISEVMDSLPEHIQILARAGMKGLLAHPNSRLLDNASNDFFEEEQSQTINHNNFDAMDRLLEKWNHKKNDSPQVNQEAKIKTSSAGPASSADDSEYWENLLFSLTPETKKTM